MEIVDKTKNKQKEQWQLGDVLKSDDGDIGMIIKDNYNNYTIIDFKGDMMGFGPFSIYELGGHDTISNLQKEYPNYHKVNAKLVIE